MKNSLKKKLPEERGKVSFSSRNRICLSEKQKTEAFTSGEIL